MSSDDEEGNDAIGALLFGDVDELSEVPWSPVELAERIMCSVTEACLPGIGSS